MEMISPLKHAHILVPLVLLTIVRAGASSNPQIEQAITRCRDKLSQDPTFPKAQHMLGMLLEAIPGSDLEEIADLSYQAGVCEERPLEAPSRVDALVRAGKSFLELGQTDRAINSYQQALTLSEDQNLVENILHQVTPLFLREDPATYSLESALGLSSLAQILTERFPSSAVTHQFQGAVHRKAGNAEVAFQSYHKATTLSLSESKAESCILAASAARQAGRDLDTQLGYLDSAMDAAGNAADLQAEVWNNRGVAYKSIGQKEQAIVCFQAALSAKPGDGHALAQLASLDALQSATAFDADYVQGLFDGYSSRFEDELVNTLEYKGHEWVAQECLQYWEGTTGDNVTIVDLGCGTGLVGQVLAANEWAAPLNLVGVDLSQRMNDITRARTLPNGSRIYQRVEQADAETFLKTVDPNSASAVVAADVFIYIGDLKGVFSACKSALAAGGLLVFSVEITSEGMILLPSGRFGHSKEYIEELAKQTGFNFKQWKEGTLRKQHLAPVRGAVVVLQKREE